MFYEIDPFGYKRGDFQAGIVASTIAEVNRDRKKRHNPYQPSEFIPEFGTTAPKAQPARRAPGQSWEQQLAILQAISIRNNAEVAQKRRLSLKGRTS